MTEAFTKKRPLSFRYALHVKAAELWLELGNLYEAKRELRQIQLSRRRHPEVAKVQEKIATESETITTMIQDDTILEPYWDRE